MNSTAQCFGPDGKTLATPSLARRWRTSRAEKFGLAIFLLVALVFGAILESRTGLRRIPMTDLGVFTTASWAVRNGQDLYAIEDFHGWHYQYPPAFAVLFLPFASPAPDPALAPRDTPRTQANTPWGYKLAHGPRWYGLHRANLPFFIIVAVWYAISLLLFCFAAHALACAMESTSLLPFPPLEKRSRAWWLRRSLPLLLCMGSVGTELSRGQVDVVMLAAIALAIYWLSRRSETSGGIALAFPASLKLFPPLFLLYPLWRRQWRVVAGVFVGAVLFMAVVPIAGLGPRRAVNEYRRWLDVLAKPALGAGTDTSRLHELTGMNATDNQSLLAVIHNWKYDFLPKRERPIEADASSRLAVAAVAGLALICYAGLTGWRKTENSGQTLRGAEGRGRPRPRGFRTQDFIESSRDLHFPLKLVLEIGILVAMALLFNPIVHHFYYLLLIPLLAALVHLWLDRRTGSRLPVALFLVAFVTIDLTCRFPKIGPALREAGIPLLSVIAIIILAFVALRSANNLKSPTASPLHKGSIGAGTASSPLVSEA